jgi:hypothetical protein
MYTTTAVAGWCGHDGCGCMAAATYDIRAPALIIAARRRAHAHSPTSYYTFAGARSCSDPALAQQLAI